MQILRRSNGTVEIWGRRLERRPNWTARLPDIAERCRRVLPKGTLVDCELSSTRGRRFVPSLFAKNPKAAPFIYVFDVLYMHNKDICELSLAERKRSLDRLTLEEPFIPLLGNALTNMSIHLKEAIDLGHEGIVIKRIDSLYSIGAQAPIATHVWRKIK
jgi:ATP-dependent DNA ligase